MAIASCGGGDEAPSYAVRDSAGVAIVENVAPSDTAAPFWRLSESPSLAIGVVEGDDPYQLFRVAGAVRLDDGTIVVANSGTGELRFFDGRGRHLRSVGRRGGGPGEFEGMWSLSRYRGDSLAVYDWRLARISVFDLEGTFVRTYRLEVAERTTVLGLFASGDVLASIAVPPEQDPSGVQRNYAEYVRFSPDGEPGARLGRFLENEMFVVQRGEATGTTGLAYGKNGLTAVHGHRFYFGSTARWEITVYDVDGAVERVIRQDVEPPPVTDADMQAHKDMVTATRRDRTRLQALLDLVDAMPAPETMPVFEGMMVDAEGNLWVRDYERPGSDAAPRWTVFDAEGRRLGQVTPPSAFSMFEIGADYVLGRGRDEWDAEQVCLYVLEKP